MKRVIVLAIAAVILAVAAAPALASASKSGIGASLVAKTATCTPTGFIRDNINLTAAQMGGTLTGSLDATGCNVGYFQDATHPGSVKNAEVYGSNYYGILIDGSAGDVKVNIHNVQVHDIGETPQNGSQHGVGIGVYGSGSGVVSGTIANFQIWNYQKNATVASGPMVNVNWNGGQINGEGPTDRIAQNGFQASSGANGSATNIDISGNVYSPQSTSSTGFILYGAGSFTVRNSSAMANDIGIYSYAPTGILSITHNVFDGSTWDGADFDNAVGAVFKNNKTNGNGEWGVGLFDSSMANTIQANTGKNNGVDGFFVEAGSTDNTFINNNASASGNYDCEDQSAGSGTAGTGNSWKHNKGVGSPVGICKASGHRSVVQMTQPAHVIRVSPAN